MRRPVGQQCLLYDHTLSSAIASHSPFDHTLFARCLRAKLAAETGAKAAAVETGTGAAVEKNPLGTELLSGALLSSIKGLGHESTVHVIRAAVFARVLVLSGFCTTTTVQ